MVHAAVSLMSDSQFYCKLLTITYCLTIYKGEKLFPVLIIIPTLIFSLCQVATTLLVVDLIGPCGYLGRLSLHLPARTQALFKGFG